MCSVISARAWAPCRSISATWAAETSPSFASAAAATCSTTRSATVFATSVPVELI